MSSYEALPSVRYVKSVVEPETQNNMREFFKKSIPVLVILAISVSVAFGYNYAKGHLRDFACEFLESNFNSKVAIGDVSIKLPICLELKDVKIGDSVEMPSVKIYPVPSPLAWRNGFITAIVKIIGSVVRIGDNTFEFVRIKGSIRPSVIRFSEDSAFQFAAKGFLKNRDVDSLSLLLINGSVEPGNVVRAKLYGSDIKLGTLAKRYLRGIIDDGAVNFESDIEIAEGRLMADCLLKTKDIMASFILLFSFKNKTLKIKDLKGNFLEPISIKS